MIVQSRIALWTWLSLATFVVARFERGDAAPYLHAPSVDTYARHDPSGLTILSNGRYLQPEGKHWPVAQFPYGLAQSRDGKALFIVSEGLGQFVTNWESGQPLLREIKPASHGRKERGSSGAADFSPDGQTLYWSAGDSGSVLLVRVSDLATVAEINLNVPVAGQNYEDSYINDLKVSADGRYVYCADVTNFRLAIIDLNLKKVVGSIRVGRYPYALAVTGNKVHVANIGLFEYQPIPDPNSDKFDKRGLTRPPFGYPSKEAVEGVEFEGRRVPGLGEPNVPESFSVWTVNVEDAAHPEVLARVKTGLLVGAPAENGKTVGGSAPNYLVAADASLFVSNGNNDRIDLINLQSGTIAASERLVPDPIVAGLRGVAPCGMVVSPDHQRLYIAELGINAIAVLDASTLKTLGHIPTAWYPYRLAISADGRHLACICFRGFGNGPSGGSAIPKSPFLGMKGSFTVLDAPSPERLRQLTAQVLAFNGIRDRSADQEGMASPVIPTEPGKVSRQIKHVVFITKENHTFDTIFDRVPGSNNDPTLLRWGLHQQLKSDRAPTLENVPVMVNHNALARQWTLSDNFYMEPEASGVGHRWLVGVQPNNLMQMTYSVGWSFKKNSTAPGRRYSMGSNASLIPEDYPEAGSMWDHLARHQISFRNYGEGFEFPGVEEGEHEAPTGAREVVNIPMPEVLFENTCFEFPIFNMNIPDQYRAHWFMKDVEEQFIRPKKPLPAFLNIAICNDHGTSPKPERGYPYVASWMADNDLALGRIVEFLSHTPEWRHMAIFVTEDDSGGEPDHVDAQRSVMLVISPWVKRGYVSHRHTTIVSMHRTLYQIFGLPPLNLFDALANDLSDCFTATPDYRPYQAQPVDPRVFDPEKAKDPNDPDYGKARKLPSIPMDDDDDVKEILKEGRRESAPR